MGTGISEKEREAGSTVPGKEGKQGCSSSVPLTECGHHGPHKPRLDNLPKSQCFSAGPALSNPLTQSDPGTSHFNSSG